MASATPQQAVQGLSRFSHDLDKSLKDALANTAEVAQRQARRNMAMQRIPQNPGAVVKTVEDGWPSVTLKYGSFPWLAGAEAGAKRFRQFRRYVGFGSRGYIVGAAIRATQERMAKEAGGELTLELKKRMNQ